MDPARSQEWNWEWRRGALPAIYHGPLSLSLFPSIHHAATLMDNATPPKVTTLDEIESAAAGTPSEIPTKIADAPAQNYAPSGQTVQMIHQIPVVVGQVRYILTYNCRSILMYPETYNST
jgi:hypothetical protein